MSDLIERQAAIDAVNSIDNLDAKARGGICIKLMGLPSAQPDLDEWCTDCKEYDSEKNCCPRFNRVIREALKDEWTERKKGRWIPQDHNKSNGFATTLVYYFPKCSECGHSGDSAFAFCPWCGADMREDNNG